MLNCHDATLLISQSQERPLVLSERLGLKVHVAMCSGCRNFEKQMPALRAAARLFAKGPDRDERDRSGPE